MREAAKDFKGTAPILAFPHRSSAPLFVVLKVRVSLVRYLTVTGGAQLRVERCLPLLRADFSSGKTFV